MLIFNIFSNKKNEKMKSGLYWIGFWIEFYEGRNGRGVLGDSIVMLIK